MRDEEGLVPQANLATGSTGLRLRAGEAIGLLWTAAGLQLRGYS